MAFAENLDKFKQWCLGTRSIEEAESGIRRDATAQEMLKVWSKRLGKATIILGVLALLTHAGFMLVPPLVAGIGYLGVKAAGYFLDRDIRNKREAEERMKAESAVQQASAPSKQPAPKPSVKAAGSFNVVTGKKPVVMATPAPANDTPKPQGFLKRFGIG